MNKALTLSPSSSNQIHHLLTPIIQEVRRNKINSFHQLERHHLMLTSDNNRRQFILQPQPKSAAELHVSPENKAKTQFNFYRGRHESIGVKKTLLFNEAGEKQPSTQLQATKEGHKRTVSVNNQQKSRLGRNLRVQSKLKKHLVESIDFQQIQKMLYKKKQTITRYEYFMQLKSLQAKMTNQMPPKTRTKPVISSCSPETINYEPDNQGCASPEDWAASPRLKTPRRRKFWSFSKQVRKSHAVEGPVVLGKMYRTVEA